LTRHWGEGSIYKRGNRYWISYSVNGKIHKESGGKTKAEARETLQARKTTIHQGTFISSKQSKITINQLLDSYITSLKIKGAKSIPTLKSGIKPIRDEFGYIRATDLVPDMMNKFILEQKKAGKANATINRRTQGLRAAYNLAVKEGKLKSVPYFSILKEDNARQGFFEQEEFEAVLKHLPDPYNDLAQFAFYTGWRKGEIKPLRWDQVDRKGREIRLKSSKNGYGRVIPLEGTLLNIIENRWQKREVTFNNRQTYMSPLVFHKKGEPVGDFRKSWNKACELAGFPNKIFHDFRRTAARNFSRAQVPESVAMSITGHKTNSIYRRYNITNMDDKRNALLSTEEHLKSQSKTTGVALPQQLQTNK
jgi:integrase